MNLSSPKPRDSLDNRSPSVPTTTPHWHNTPSSSLFESQIKTIICQWLLTSQISPANTMRSKNVVAWTMARKSLNFTSSLIASPFVNPRWGICYSDVSTEVAVSGCRKWWSCSKGWFTLWLKVERLSNSTNEIARKLEIGLLTLHSRGHSPKAVAFKSVYMAILFYHFGAKITTSGGRIGSNENGNPIHGRQDKLMGF